jgi:hypothetical protein
MNSILNRYDNEFIGLLNEIGNRLIYFKKDETMKIKSWIKILSFPYESKEAKQNRNLYAIKLINQMINRKIKSPFNKYPDSYELKPILPIDVKSELTKKFYKEINMKNVANFGYQKQNQFLNSYPKYYNTFQNNINIKPIINNNNDLENKKYLSYNSEFMTNNIVNNNSNDNMKLYWKSINLKSEKNSNNFSNDYDFNLNEEDNGKLYKIIEDLENKLNETDKIIETQTYEINKLTNYLEKIMSQIKSKGEKNSK